MLAPKVRRMARDPIAAMQEFLFERLIMGVTINDPRWDKKTSDIFHTTIFAFFDIFYHLNLFIIWFRERETWYRCRENTSRWTIGNYYVAEGFGLGNSVQSRKWRSVPVCVCVFRVCAPLEAGYLSERLALRKLYFLSNWMGHDRGDSFPSLIFWTKWNSI